VGVGVGVGMGVGEVRQYFVWYDGGVVWCNLTGDKLLEGQ
jgi:hypothetical protein